MGSQRIPFKNALEIAPGLNLTQQAIDCGLAIGPVIVSTDQPDKLDIRGASVSLRPPGLSGPTTDILEVVRHELARIDYKGDYVAILQPAVLARSQMIVRRLANAVVKAKAAAGVTVARLHPWIWQEVGVGKAETSWGGPQSPYPRSQDCHRMWQEINSVLITTREQMAGNFGEDDPELAALDKRIAAARTAGDAAKPTWALAKRVADKLVRKQKAIEGKLAEVDQLVLDKAEIEKKISEAQGEAEKLAAQLEELKKELHEVKAGEGFRYVFLENDYLKDIQLFQYPLALQKLALFVLETHKVRSIPVNDVGQTSKSQG
jgi:CMP-N-acetylneuraminic acid synthetase